MRGCLAFFWCILLFLAFMGVVISGVTLLGASMHQVAHSTTRYRINQGRQAE